MRLTPIEAQSALWARLKQHLENELEAARRRNDGDLNEIDTARLRGRIACIRSLLAIGDPPTQGTPEADA